MNKDGSQDRRYCHNRQLPVCDYGVLRLIANPNLSIELQTSNTMLPANFAGAYRNYSLYMEQRKLYNPVDDAEQDSSDSFAREDCSSQNDAVASNAPVCKETKLISVADEAVDDSSVDAALFNEMLHFLKKDE